MSRIVPHWDMSEGKLSHFRRSCTEVLTERWRNTNIPTYPPECIIYDISPDDVGLSTWQIPETGVSGYTWVSHATQSMVTLCLFGIAWIDGKVGPQSMEVFLGGNRVGFFSLSRLYSPLVAARWIGKASDDTLDTLAPYILEKAMEGDSDNLRFGLRMEGFFTEPIIIDSNHLFEIRLNGGGTYGLERNLVLIGFAAKPIGMVTV